METGKYNQDGLEFRQIVLSHIKKILEISSAELRDRTTTKIHGNYSEVVDSEDTRVSYVQAIENLAFILIPYFDKEAKKVYEECVKVMNAYDFRIEIMFKEDIEQIKKDIGKEVNLTPYALDRKIEYSKKLFVALNLLLKRNDYLKSSVYGENLDEVAREDGEE